MTSPRGLSYSILVLLALACPPFAGAQREVEKNLMELYGKWRRSMVEKSYARWSESTASFRQVQVRNAIVSQGEEFPEALFAIPLKPPSIGDLKLLRMKTAGLTANLIFFGRVDLGFAEGRVPENILVLSFVLERAKGWRFDNSRLVNLAGIPEVRADLAAGRYDFLESPELEPRGAIPPVPAACPKPDFFGRIDVAANGYEVVMKVNGFEYPAISNTGRRNVVIGGFKDGENSLDLSVRKIDLPEGESPILELAAFASRRPQTDEVTEVFRWEPGDEVPDRFANPIWVTADKVPR